VQDLGSLVPGGRSRAYNINARGEVVGSSASADGERAFLWTAATGMLDLNSLVASSGLRLTEAVGINERGYIVALGHEAHEGAAGDHDDHEQPKQVVVLVPF
jgi:probable HAF family extracellular repeat protein